MLFAEALWIKDALGRLDVPAIRSVLNVGSSTREFRTKVQPHIDGYVFTPLKERGCEVVHLDIKPADGVDLVGDLTDPKFCDEVRSRRFRLVVCSNLLEHIESPAREELCRTLGEIVVPGGYLLYTVPRSYPYHDDPIDTMYRPSVADLSDLHPGWITARSATVTRRDTSRRDVTRRATRALRAGAYGYFPRLFGVGACEARRYRASVPHCFRWYQMTCLLLQRPENL